MKETSPSFNPKLLTSITKIVSHIYRTVIFDNTMQQTQFYFIYVLHKFFDKHR